MVALWKFNERQKTKGEGNPLLLNPHSSSSSFNPSLIMRGSIGNRMDVEEGDWKEESDEEIENGCSHLHEDEDDKEALKGKTICVVEP